MKKILVPIDFSPSSQSSSAYAAALAKVMGAEIRLVHVYKDLTLATAGPEPWTVTSGSSGEQKEVLINKEAELLNEKYSIRVTGELIRGFKATSIKDAAEDMKADLIVMGMKSGKRSKLPGSTALKMIRKTNIPVLVIPEGTTYTPLKNIVLAVDFNEMVESTSLKSLFEIIHGFDASLQVVHVEEKGAEVKASELPEKLQLGRVLSRATYLYDHVESDDVDQGLMAFIQNHPADLLAMIAHHHNVFERVFKPVHTRNLSSEIKLPLLVLKDVS